MKETKPPIHRQVPENERYRVNKVKNVAPASRTVTHEKRGSFTSGTPEKGAGHRFIPTDKINTRRG